MKNIDYLIAYKERCRQLKKLGLANEELNDYSNFEDLMNKDSFEEVMRTKHNRQQKRNRTKNKIKDLFILKDALNKESKIVFITITLNDEILNQKEDTYIRKIHKWLKKHFLITVLNKDYGKETDREHYHGTGITVEELEQLFHKNGKPKKSKTGYYMFELKNKDFKETIKTSKKQFEPTLNIIDLTKDDIKKTTNYLLKLNNHSSKEAVKGRVRVIKSPLMKLIEKK